MKRRDAIRNAILGGAAFTLAPGILTKCEKDYGPPGESIQGMEAQPSQLMKINLDNPEYVILKQQGGTMVLPGDINIANAGVNGFLAASSKCPHNGGKLCYNGNSLKGEGVWRCAQHCSGFGCDGKCLCGPALTNLKVYSVQRNNNTLTIYL